MVFGDGTFAAPIVADAGGRNLSLIAGDFDGDGVTDVATANTDSTIQILLGNGDGTFATPITHFEPISVLDLGVGDFNNVTPADSTHFKSMKPFLRNVIQRMDFTEGPQDLFTIDAIGKRVNFVRTDGDDDTEEDSSEEAQS